MQTLFSGTAESGQDYRFTVQGASLAAGLCIGSLPVDGRVQTVRRVLTR